MTTRHFIDQPLLLQVISFQSRGMNHDGYFEMTTRHFIDQPLLLQVISFQSRGMKKCTPKRDPHKVKSNQH
jgi:hypothetical protein